MDKIRTTLPNIERVKTGHTPTSSLESEEFQEDLVEMMKYDPRITETRERCFFADGEGGSLVVEFLANLDVGKSEEGKK